MMIEFVTYFQIEHLADEYTPGTEQKLMLVEPKC